MLIIKNDVYNFEAVTRDDPDIRPPVSEGFQKEHNVNCPEEELLYIVCEGKTFPVNKSLAAVFSPALKKAGQKPDRKFHLEGFKAEHARCLVEYMTRSRYDAPRVVDVGDDYPVSHPAFNVKMYTLAQKYEIKGLDNMAYYKFRDVFGSSPRTMELVLETALAVAELPKDTSAGFRESVRQLAAGQAIAIAWDKAKRQCGDLCDKVLRESPEFEDGLNYGRGEKS